MPQRLEPPLTDFQFDYRRIGNVIEDIENAQVGVTFDNEKQTWVLVDENSIVHPLTLEIPKNPVTGEPDASPANPVVTGAFLVKMTVRAGRCSWPIRDSPARTSAT